MNKLDPFLKFNQITFIQNNISSKRLKIFFMVTKLPKINSLKWNVLKISLKNKNTMKNVNSIFLTFLFTFSLILYK